MVGNDSTRRPLSSRNTKWATAAAGWLARTGLQPNQISLLSLVFAALAGVSFGLTNYCGENYRPGLYILAALGIQLRLLCNLFDGMVAVEQGLKTKSGEIYNELPDRFADIMILIGAGYSISNLEWLPTAGWLAAVLAVTTAYVRALGVSAGTKQYFLGPMAKPHRMAVLTVACLFEATGGILNGNFKFIPLALVLICLGCLVTIARRVHRVLKELETK